MAPCCLTSYVVISCIHTHIVSHLRDGNYHNPGKPIYLLILSMQEGYRFLLFCDIHTYIVSHHRGEHYRNQDKPICLLAFVFPAD